MRWWLCCTLPWHKNFVIESAMVQGWEKIRCRCERVYLVNHDERRVVAVRR